MSGGYRNDALTFVNSGAIARGRAVKLTSTGVITALADADADVVLGWALNSRASTDALPTGVRMMSEGTMECEFDPDRDANIVRGTALYLTDEGLVTDQTTDSSIHIGYSLQDASGEKYIECLILRQYPLVETAAIS